MFLPLFYIKLKPLFCQFFSTFCCNSNFNHEGKSKVEGESGRVVDGGKRMGVENAFLPSFPLDCEASQKLLIISVFLNLERVYA